MNNDILESSRNQALADCPRLGLRSALLESDRNRKLADLYRRNWPALLKIRKDFEDFDPSYPHLVWVHPDYEKANIRLVIVGMESRFWNWESTVDLDYLNDEERKQALTDEEREEKLEAVGRDQAVERLMQFFREGKLGINYNQVFCRSCFELYRRLNSLTADDKSLGFVTLNASKFDQKGKSPAKNVALRDALIHTKILPQEIKILAPHVVVFHTGPDYDPWLDGYFLPDKIERTDIFPAIHLGDRFLSQVAVAGIPKHSFRTYHPGYLNRHQDMFKAVYDQIEAVVNSARLTQRL